MDQSQDVEGVQLMAAEALTSWNRRRWGAGKGKLDGKREDMVQRKRRREREKGEVYRLSL
jgi:hypothetical protein